jgi:hypothetical protein
MMDPQRMPHPNMHGGMYTSGPQAQPQTVASGMMPPHPGMSHQMGQGGNTHVMGGQSHSGPSMSNQMTNQGYHNQMQQQNPSTQITTGQQQSSYNPSMQQSSSTPTNNMLLPQQQQQSHPQQQKKDLPGRQMGNLNNTTTLPPISHVQGSSVSTSNASVPSF